MTEQLVAFLVALQFLTTCPPLLKRVFTPPELGRAVGYFPLVGGLLGAILAGLAIVLDFVFPPAIRAILVLMAWVIMTGSLHVDGFLDACDGLFGGHTPEDRLRIMRDERVGGFALSGGILLFLAKYAALSSLVDSVAALFVAPMLGRWAMTLAIVAFPYARSEGLGRAMKDHAGAGRFILATFITVVAVLLAATARGLLALGVTAVVTLALIRFALRRVPGLTGDIYGAVCEVVETCVLITFTVMVR